MPAPSRAKMPRKSAIRATPQVFQSPTVLGNNPEHNHIRTSRDEMAHVVEKVARESLDELVDERLRSPGLPNPFASLYRTSSVSPTKNESRTTIVAAPSVDADRKRRRVTFSAIQDRTDFEQDEPTMSIKPAQLAQDKSTLMDRGSPVPNDVSASMDESDVSMSLVSDGSTAMDESRADDEGGSGSADESGTMEFTSAWTRADEGGEDLDAEESAEAESAADEASVDMELTGRFSVYDTSTDTHATMSEADSTQTMDLTMGYTGLDDQSASTDTTLDSEAERSAMEMTEMWGRFAEEATRKREAEAASTAELSPKRSPVRRQTMFLSPDRKPIKATPKAQPETPKAAPQRPTPRPATPAATALPSDLSDSLDSPAPASPTPSTLQAPSTPSTPTRFRQSLRAGVPSPEYRHSPARRALTTPPTGIPRPFGTARVPSPSPQTREAHARLVKTHTPSWPRSPFIHSLLRHRGRMSHTHISPHSDVDEESMSEASFHMPLGEFLSVVGLKFHEDMTASRTHAERPAHAGDMRAPSAVQHAKMAGAAAPMLQALRNACQELKQHVDDGRERLHAMEDDFFARPPAFVQEWGQLEDEDMRRSMKGQLNVHKQAARAAAMHDYYGWRTDMQYDDEMVAALTQHRDALRRDAERVHARRIELAEHVVPALRARHAELRRRVDEARARQQAIRECNPDELRELHASIDEQDHVLQTMRAKQRDVADQLSRVHARLEETAARHAQTEELIRAARVVSDQIHGCTPGEAVRLERQISHLELLLEWSLTSKTSTLWQFVYARALNVAIELDGRRSSDGAAVKRVAISPVHPDASHMHMAAVAVIRAHMDAHAPASVVDVLRRVAQLWHVYVEARAQIDRLRTYMPVTISPSQDDAVDTAVDVQADVLLERARAKAHVHIAMDLALETPMAPGHVRVDVVYGHLDASTMTDMIESALTSDAHSPHALAHALRRAQDVMDA